MRSNILKFVAVIVIFAGGWYYMPAFGRSLAKKKAKAEYADQTKIFEQSNFPYDWIRTNDEEYVVIAGNSIDSDLLVKWELMFTTTDAPSQIIQAYKEYASEKGWTVDSQTPVSDGTVLSIDLNQLGGALSVKVVPNGSGATVSLIRRFVP